MGRYYFSKKEEADYLKQVSVTFLNKNDYFSCGFHSGSINWSRQGMKTGNISIRSYISEDEQYVELIYTQTDRTSEEKTDLDYKIPLITSSCHFGGKRYWFKCPWYSNGVYCGRRVGVLYLSDKYFACRHCNNLTYNSRNLGGLSKTAGQVISYPYLDELRQQVKRDYYAGKMTRKYKKLLKKEKQSERQLLIMAIGLGAFNPKELRDL